MLCAFFIRDPTGKLLDMIGMVQERNCLFDTEHAKLFISFRMFSLFQEELAGIPIEVGH